MKLRPLLTVALVGSLASCFAACVGDDPAPGPTLEKPAGPAIACSAASPCATGTCVDGYCCNTPCTGLCESCSAKGSEGTCTAVTGAPLHGKCDGDAEGLCAGSCDGKNTAACAYPDVECGESSCAAGQATIAPRCKGGSCPAPTVQACVMGCFEQGCLGVKQLATGAYPAHACALMTDGKVRCWGANEEGQCGREQPSQISRPQEVPQLTGVTMLAATGGTTCALIADGTVRCFGSNANGELGTGGTDLKIHAIPELVSNLSGVTFIAGGSGSVFCAIVAGGEIRCWGGNRSGQLGIGAASDPVPSPTVVCAPGQTTLPCAPSSGATYVANGDAHGCAIFRDGEVACWGNNAGGACGQPPSDAPAASLQPYPKLIAAIDAAGTKLAATTLTAGNDVTCASTTSGGAACWGSNGIAGRIGNCDESNGRFGTPQSVGVNKECTSPLGGVTSVSTHDESVCAVSNGAVKCWGTNADGQLGDGNITGSQPYAATTAVAAGAVQVASGGTANYAVVVDGANRDVRCWGSEADLQCGTGGTSMVRPLPVAPAW